MSVASNTSGPLTEKDFRRILGIRFYVGPLDGLLALTQQGGLIAVPSAPVLTRLPEDSAHREAVEGCDFAITDSGFMVLLWRLMEGGRIERISGLRFLIALLATPDFRKEGGSFWVMPNVEDAAANQRWLAGEGIHLANTESYCAPQYAPSGSIGDPALLARLEQKRPGYIVLCLGGGVQERLGYYLRTHLSYRPAIICTGAAIAFLSGRQARIPVWADRFFLGWLFRMLRDPARFFPRYWHALRLAPLLLKHRQDSVGA